MMSLPTSFSLTSFGRILTAFAFAIILNTLSAQDYLPTLREHAVWDISIGEGMGSFRHVYPKLLCDSVVLDGKVYQRLSLYDPAGDCTTSMGYVREDMEEKQVYFRSGNAASMYADEEVLIADYSLSIGDAIQLPGVTAPLTVDTVFMRTWIDGQAYKFFQLSSPTYSYSEGLGSHFYGVVPDCYAYTSLVGYELMEDCNEPVATQDLSDNSGIVCYPNPASGRLHIRRLNQGSPDLEIIIYNPSGLPYYRAQFTETETVINLSAFPKTLLFVAIYENGRLRDVQKIVHN
jgi:hypothetical protein